MTSPWERNDWVPFTELPASVDNDGAWETLVGLAHEAQDGTETVGVAP